ncbi:MAG: hypothetical protein JWP22_8 [Ramlibacter sp.]|nr:hypothetical protein [Ramlibacter sp.]MDB5911333.1 hypothetical protein [Ramlibacter sp.]
MDFAERLGLWLNAFDAIRLQSAHQAVRGVAAATLAKPQARPGRAPGLGEDLQRLRSSLAQAIAQPIADLDAADASYVPFQQRHLKLQREMEQAIGALREQARHALSACSGPLRQLALLDAALDQVMGPREQLLLPGAAHLLQRRFEQLRTQAADGWLALFANDWRQALVGELELRLEPLMGLVEALDEELKQRE